MRQPFGHEHFGHPELVVLMNDLDGQEGSQLTNHFKPTFRLLKREKQGGRTTRIDEKKPQTPYERLLGSVDITAAKNAELRAQHVQLNPFALKNSSEAKLKTFFTALRHLNCKAAKL